MLRGDARLGGGEGEGITRAESLELESLRTVSERIISNPSQTFVRSFQERRGMRDTHQ